jgi:DinB family protein
VNDSVLRDSLVEFLTEGHAHVSARQALDGVKPQNRGKRPAAEVHSVWEELEHLRLAQEDILRYTIDANWQSPPWPEGYWPAKVEVVTDEMWKRSVDGFLRDLDEVVKLVRDSALDLTSIIPHTSGHTYLREVVLVADHNAYHVGEIVQARKLLGDWQAK